MTTRLMDTEGDMNACNPIRSYRLWWMRPLTILWIAFTVLLVLIAWGTEQGRKQERTYRVTMEAAFAELPTAGVIANEKGEILSFSKGAEKMFGVTAAEMLGKNADLLVPESMQKEHHDALSRAAERGELSKPVVTVDCDAKRIDTHEEFPSQITLRAVPMYGELRLIISIDDRRNIEVIGPLGDEVLDRGVQ